MQIGLLRPGGNRVQKDVLCQAIKSTRMKTMIKTLPRTAFLGLVSSFLLVGTCSAANFYVRAGASGANNGSDWANAWRDASSINYGALNAGDTVYFAAGTYGALVVAKGGAAGSPITFKRATGAQHGTDAGWSSGFDGKVIFDGANGFCAVCVGGSVQADHVTIDGATRYGMWARNAMYGVKPRGPRNAANNLTLRYMELGDAGAYKLGEDGIQGLGNNLVVEYSYVHDNDELSTHGDGIQWFEGNNIILRYNVFKNNGQHTMLGEAAWSVYANDVQIYYNVFYNRGGSHYNGITAHSGSPQSGRFFRIYNNTFDLEATSNSGYNNLFNLASPIGQVDFKNNAVIYSNAGSLSKTTHSFNAFDNSGEYAVYNIPSETGRVVAADLGFVNAASGDYRPTSTSPLLKKGVGVGLTRDFDGKSVSSTPTIGAFEPAGSTAALSAPTNLRIAP